MGYPITKQITVVWDGVEWHDQETGVLVTGVPSPYPSDEPKHPFDKSFSVTYEQVQRMINVAFDARTYHSPYFWPAIEDRQPDGLMTYRDTQRAIEYLLSNTVAEIWRAIRRIDQPWWKRW